MVKILAGDGVNRRNSPGGSIVGAYVRGTIVQVIGRSGDWYKEAAGTYITADSRWAGDLYGTVTADGLNVRTGNSIVTVIYRGTSVAVLKKSGNWYYIQTGVTKGWVYGDYLSL